MAKMMGRNLKRSRTSFTPFSECPCCDGPTPKGRAAEKREWTAEVEDD